MELKQRPYLVILFFKPEHFTHVEVLTGEGDHILIPMLKAHSDFFLKTRKSKDQPGIKKSTGSLLTLSLVR